MIFSRPAFAGIRKGKTEPTKLSIKMSISKEDFSPELLKKSIIDWIVQEMVTIENKTIKVSWYEPHLCNIGGFVCETAVSLGTMEISPDEIQ